MIWCKETPQPPFSTPAAQGWLARLFAALVLGLMPTQPIWPTSGEVRQPSPPLLLPTLSPFTKLLIAIHKEVLASTFRHLYLLAGKLQDFIGPEETFRLQKESSVSLPLEEGDPLWGSESERNTWLADPAQDPQTCGCLRC